MGFITRSIFVCKYIISGLKPVHLSCLLFAKQEEADSMCSCRVRRIMKWSGSTLAVIQFRIVMLSQGITVKMPQESSPRI